MNKYDELKIKYDKLKTVYEAMTELFIRIVEDKQNKIEELECVLEKELLKQAIKLHKQTVNEIKGE